MNAFLTDLRVSNVQILNLSNPPEGVELNIDFSCTFNHTPGSSTGESKVSVKISPKGDIVASNNFNISVEILAQFETPSDMTLNDFQEEAFKQVFPHIRATVASITASCLIPAVMIPNISVPN